jgi:hypothetical protein
MQYAITPIIHHKDSLRIHKISINHIRGPEVAAQQG